MGCFLTRALDAPASLPKRAREPPALHRSVVMPGWGAPPPPLSSKESRRYIFRYGKLGVVPKQSRGGSGPRRAGTGPPRAPSRVIYHLRRALQHRVWRPRRRTGTPRDDPSLRDHRRHALARRSHHLVAATTRVVAERLYASACPMGRVRDACPVAGPDAVGLDGSGAWVALSAAVAAAIVAFTASRLWARVWRYERAEVRNAT